MKKKGKHAKIIKVLTSLSLDDFAKNVYNNRTITGIYRDLGWKGKVSGNMCNAVRVRSAKEGPDLDTLGYTKDHSTSYDIATAMCDTGRDKNFFYDSMDRGDLYYFMKKRFSDGRTVRYVYKTDARSLAKQTQTQKKMKKAAKVKKTTSAKPKLPVPPDSFKQSEESLSSKEQRLIAECKVIDNEINILTKKKNDILNNLEMVRKVRMV